ncbi:MAG: hypothetical protein FD167_3666 [bacterium]|nr:MAG: hypothetical protein FD167_3666 [bacterium]
MIKVYNRENGDFIGTINEEQLELLIDQLEEETSKTNSYYIDSNTIDYLTDSGADEELIETLKKSLGEDEGVEIYIEEEESITR